MDSKTAFGQVFNKVAVSKNFVQPDPSFRRLDNWSSDRYEAGDVFAVSADSGYTHMIGVRVDGKVVWRVDHFYPNPLQFRDITEEQFVEWATGQLVDK